MCSVLGRALFEHEVKPALSVVLPAKQDHRDGMLFETFRSWFEKLLGVDECVRQMFAQCDANQVGFIGPGLQFQNLLAISQGGAGQRATSLIAELYSLASTSPSNLSPRRRFEVSAGSPRGSLLSPRVDSIRFRVHWHQHASSARQALGTPATQRSAQQLDEIVGLLKCSTFYVSVGPPRVAKECCRYLSLASFRQGSFLNMNEHESTMFVVISGNFVCEDQLDSGNKFTQ